MSKHDELVQGVTELAKELGVEAKTEGLSNADLMRLSVELQQQKRGREAVAAPAQPNLSLGGNAALGGQPAPAAPSAAPPAAPPPKPPVIDGAADENSGTPPAPVPSRRRHAVEIAPGRAYYGGNRGIHYQQGDPVRPGDFDEETLAVLIGKGVVIDNRKR